MPGPAVLISSMFVGPSRENPVWDRNDRAGRGVGRGRRADSPADATQDAIRGQHGDWPGGGARTSTSVQPVFFAAGANKTILEMSTAGPGIAQELAIAAKLNGARLIERPVMGSVPAVQQRNPGHPGRCGVGRGPGGSAAGLAATWRGALCRRGSEARPRSSLVANCFLAIVSAAAAEMIAPGQGAAWTGKQVFWALTRLAPVLKTRKAGFVRNLHEPTMFAIRDMLKDLDLGLGLYQPVRGSVSAVSAHIVDPRAVRQRRITSAGPGSLGNRQRVFDGPAAGAAEEGGLIMSLLRRPLGTSGLQITQVGFRRVGGRRWRLGLRLGKPVRRRFDRGDPARGHAWASTGWTPLPSTDSGHSEEVVDGRSRELPASERPLVFTKRRLIADPSRPFEEPERNLRP